MASLSRKDFLKKMGLGIGLAAAAPFNNVFAGHLNDENLTDTKKEFLTEYQEWLQEFNGFVSKRNENTLDKANNQRLMELSAEAEKRKPQLEQYMKDPKFADYFNQITASVTQNIQV